MQSKTSLFNGTIFKKNIKRSWPLWGVIAFCGAMIDLGVTTLLKVNSSGFDTKGNDTAEYYYSALETGGPIVALIYGIIVAGFVWNYLYTNKSVGFYSSLPLTRLNLFITNFVSGLAILAIPFLITGFLSIPACAIVGSFSMKAFCTALFGSLLECFFFFSFATLIAHVTGTRASLVLLYLIFNFINVLIEFLATGMASALLWGVEMDYTGRLDVLSPIVEFYRSVRMHQIRDEVTFEVIGVEFIGFYIILIYAAVAVVMTIVSMLIYSRRKNETATEIISLKALKPIILGFLSIVTALWGGILLNYVVTGFKNLGACNPVILTICTLVAGAIGYYVCLMLMEKTIRVFKKKALPEFVLLSVAYVIMIAFFGLDLGHVEEKLPDIDEIEYVYFTSGEVRVNLFEEDREQIETVLETHKAIIADRDRQIGYAKRSTGLNQSHVNIWYEKKNGEKLNRSYAIYCEDECFPRTDPIVDKIYDVLDDPKVLLKECDVEGYEFEYGNYGIYIEDNYNTEDFGEEEAKIVIKAIRQDISEGNITSADMYHLSGCWDMEETKLHLYFNYLYEKKDMYDWKEINIYSVERRMKHTVDALLELGVIDEDSIEEYFHD